jgi:iron complex transport system substrate-binding protein
MARDHSTSDARRTPDRPRSSPPPVEVEHEFGTTTIDTVPQRIVTIDVQWTDVMLAMGVGPDP